MALERNTIREKGIKLKGMTRRVTESEVLSNLRPYGETVFLLNSDAGASICFLSPNGQVMDLIIEDDDVSAASQAYLEACGLPVFDEVEEAIQSVKQRSRSVFLQLVE